MQSTLVSIILKYASLPIGPSPGNETINVFDAKVRIGVEFSYSLTCVSYGRSYVDDYIYIYIWILILSTFIYICDLYTYTVFIVVYLYYILYAYSFES